MPKATKKKKEKVADFTKAKLKLGKGKKQASNATDTSFKARSIALPGQEALSRSLLVAEGSSGGPSEPTTANGLTLDDLFIRFRHPNAGVRKEAIGGVKEILMIRISKEIGKVLRALGGLVSDEDATVRKALIGILSWYLPQIPVPALSPHLPLLVLQTSSALSHIFPEIRLDACKLVHLLLTHVPTHVVGSWPRQPSNILEGLRLAVGLGGEKGVNSQIGRLTGGAKLVTLRAMAEFVRKGLDADEGQKEEWLEGWIEQERVSRSATKAPEKAVREEPTLEGLQEEGWVVRGTWDVNEHIEESWELGRIAAQGNQEVENGVSNVLSQLYIQLHPLLLSTFLESAPTAFSPSLGSFASASSTEDIPLALCTTTATLTHLLGRSILASTKASSSGSTTSDTYLSAEMKEARGCVSDFLKRMAAWFPFHASASASSTSGLRATTTAATLAPSGLTPAFELSLVYANLAMLLTPRPVELAYPRELTRGKKEVGWRERVKAIEIAWNDMREREKGGNAKSKGKGKANGADHWAMEEVAEWVVDILSPKKDVFAQSTLTPAAYSALLPIIFALITRPPPSSTSAQEEEEDIPMLVGTAFLSHLSRQASTSAIRSIGDGFLVSLIVVHEQRYPRYPFFVLPTSKGGKKFRAAIQAWFEGLPKVLWELGVRDPKATRGLLEFLLYLGLRGKGALMMPFSLLDPETFPLITSKLSPFFYLSHPTKGAIQGPWAKFPQSIDQGQDNIKLKKLGLDVARVWSEWSTDGKLGDAAGRAVRGSGLEDYWAR
ncbi:pre-rRNA-processing protein IPI1 [Kwoniella heveanensis CBS 569]|nr:pre-rRNA-processing protein IPI1 [Kwoniella heveanensis CBS 569]